MGLQLDYKIFILLQSENFKEYILVGQDVPYGSQHRYYSVAN